MLVKEEKFDYSKIINNIDFDKLYGSGGSFLVSPLNAVSSKFILK